MGIGRFVEYKETRHDEGSIRPPIIVAYRPLSCYIKNAISHFFRNFSQKSLADMKIKP